MSLRFDQLVSALAHAVVDAQHQVRQTHIGELSQFFKDGTPVSVDLQLPRVSPETGRQKPIRLKVPLLTLVHPGQMSIQEMNVTMQVDMSEIAKTALEEGTLHEPITKAGTQPYEWKSSGPPVLIAASTTTGKKPGDVGLAQVTIRVAADDPPEGLARLLDHLNKSL